MKKVIVFPFGLNNHITNQIMKANAVFFNCDRSTMGNLLSIHSTQRLFPDTSHTEHMIEPYHRLHTGSLLWRVITFS